MKYWLYSCKNKVYFHTFRNSVVYYMKSIVTRKKLLSAKNEAYYCYWILVNPS